MKKKTVYGALLIFTLGAVLFIVVSKVNGQPIFNQPNNQGNIFNQPNNQGTINNTVNESEHRIITLTQREVMIKELKKYPSQHAYILRIGDREATNFAYDIATVLAAGGWSVEIINYAWMMPGAAGISCQIPNSNYSDFCNIVTSVFAKANLPMVVKVNARGSDYPTAILVGYMP